MKKKNGQKSSAGRRRAATGVLVTCIAMAVGSGFMLARDAGCSRAYLYI